VLLVLFIPSKDRRNEPVEHRYCVKETLTVLGTLFGEATAFPRSEGIWHDDAQGSNLLFEKPLVIQYYTSEHSINEKMPVGPRREQQPVHDACATSTHLVNLFGRLRAPRSLHPMGRVHLPATFVG
jgi:hypothetical protein